MTRRHFALLAAAGAARAASTLNGTPPKTTMGICTTSFMVSRPKDTIEFLEHCHQLGAGGIQAGLSSTEPEYLKRLRGLAEQYGMYIETMTSLPETDDTSAFEHALAAAKEVGALAVRTQALHGRRYEIFTTYEEWQAASRKGQAAVKRGAQIAEKMKMPVALENHKEWTIGEYLGIMKQYGGEYFGMLLDFGNNISLLDEPMAIMDLAPYTLATHVKDMAVEPYEDGFLLSEMILGEGILDLKKVVAAIQQAKPKTRFTLEMISRDPLKVPCLTDKYWVTFPDRNGLYLARTLEMVQKTSVRLQKLPRMDFQSKAAQMRLEEENVHGCLHYAREALNLT